MSFAQLLRYNTDPRSYLSPSFVAYIALALVVHASGLYVPFPGAAVGWGELARWFSLIAARSIALTWVVYSSWYWLMYERRPRLSMKKLNTKIARPPAAQLRFEQRHALCGAVIGALAEAACAVVHARDEGSDGGLLRACWLVYLGAIFSDYHFFFAHRVLHPWWPAAPPGARLDPGRALYRLVHSLHHKATNPNPWSGLSMHWFEHLLYFSRAPLFVLLCCRGGSHPAVFLFINIRALIGPAPGHHGFEDCLGSHFHYLHHVYHNCNFGTRPSDGMDWACGSLREDRERLTHTHTGAE